MARVWPWFVLACAIASTVGCDEVGRSSWRAEYAKPAALDPDGRLAYFNYLLEHENDPLPDPALLGPDVPQKRWSDGSESPAPEDPQMLLRDRALTATREARVRLGTLPFHPLTVGRMASFAGVARDQDPALAAAARRWLSRQAEPLLASYWLGDRVVESAGTDPLWQRGVNDWIAWLKTDYDVLGDAGKLTVAAAFFACNGPVASTLEPLIDRFGFGRRIVDDWIRAGRPMAAFAFADRKLSSGRGEQIASWVHELSTEDVRTVLFQKVVLGPTDCVPRRSRMKPLDVAAFVAPGWMSAELATPEGTRRLVTALVEYREPALFLGLLAAVGRTRLDELLRPFPSDARVTAAVNQAIILGTERRLAGGSASQ